MLNCNSDESNVKSCVESCILASPDVFLACSLLSNINLSELPLVRPDLHCPVGSASSFSGLLSLDQDMLCCDSSLNHDLSHPCLCLLMLLKAFPHLILLVLLGVGLELAGGVVGDTDSG